MLLSTALQAAEDAVNDGQHECQTLQEIMRDILLGGSPVANATGSHSNAGDVVDRLDYAVVVDAETLMPMERINQSAVALIAAFVGSTRLIDNRTLQLQS